MTTGWIWCVRYPRKHLCLPWRSTLPQVKGTGWYSWLNELLMRISCKKLGELDENENECCTFFRVRPKTQKSGSSEISMVGFVFRFVHICFYNLSLVFPKKKITRSLIRENKFGANPLLPFGSLAFPGFGFVFFYQHFPGFGFVHLIKSIITH